MSAFAVRLALSLVLVAIVAIVAGDDQTRLIADAPVVGSVPQVEPATSVEASSTVDSTGESGSLEVSTSSDDSEFSGDAEKILIGRDRLTQRKIQEILDARHTGNWTAIAIAIQNLSRESEKNTGTQAASDLIEISGVFYHRDTAYQRLVEALPSEGKEAVSRLIQPEIDRRLRVAVQNQDLKEIQALAQRYSYTPAGLLARQLLVGINYDQGHYSLENLKENSQNGASANQSTGNQSTGNYSVAGPTFSTDSNFPDVTRQQLEQLEQQIRQSGVIPYLNCRLQSNDDVIVTSFPLEHVAVDRHHGQVLWTRPNLQYSAVWARNPDNLEDLSRQRNFKVGLAGQVFGDSLINRAVLNAQTCFIIEIIPLSEIPLPEEVQKRIDQRREALTATPADAPVPITAEPEVVGEPEKISEAIPDTKPEGESVAPAAATGDSGAESESETAAESVKEPVKEAGETVEETEEETEEETVEGTEEGTLEEVSEASSVDTFLSTSRYHWNIAFRPNRLQALDAQTGELRWSFSGAKPMTVSFLGSPTIDGNLLYVLGQSSVTSSIDLFVLSADTGELLDQINIAQSGAPILADPRYECTNSSPIIGPDSILCPVANGILFSVDRLTSQLSWIQRFPIESANRSDVNIPESTPQTLFERFEAWQNTSVEVVDEVVIFVSPGSRHLQAVNRLSGEVLWRKARETGMHLALADREHGALVINKNSAELIRIQDGRPLWSAAIPAPVGRGFIQGSDYVYPIQSFGTAKLDLQTGLATVDVGTDPYYSSSEKVLPFAVRTRNLQSINNVIYEVSAGEVRLVPSRELQNQQADILRERLKKQFSERAEWLSDDRSLFTSTEQASNQFLEILSGLYREAESEADREFIEQSVKELDLPSQQQAIWKRNLAQDALLREDYRAFGHYWITLSPSELQTFVSTGSGENRSRLDRWFQAEAQLRAQTGDAAVYTRIQSGIMDGIQGGSQGKTQGSTNGRNSDPVVMSSLNISHWLHLGRTPWAQDLVGQLTQTPETLTEKLQIRTAQSWANSTPDQKATGGVEWPRTTPIVTHRRRPSAELNLYQFEVKQVGQYPGEKLDVDVDFPGHQGIRFRTHTSPRGWLSGLPSTERVFRGEASLDQCWNLNGFYLFQSGSELFAIAPFDLTDRRRAVILWGEGDSRIDLIGDRDNLMISQFESKVSDDDQLGSLVPQWKDEFGHPLNRVAYVGEEIICFQQMGMVVAIDSITGAELWRHYGVPRGGLVYSDANQVLITSSETKENRVLSLHDGRVLEKGPSRFDVRNSIHIQGLESLIIDQRLPLSNAIRNNDLSRADESSLRVEEDVKYTLKSLVTGDSHWSRNWRSGSHFASIDDQRFAILEPDGQLSVISWSSGQTLQSDVVTPDLTVAFFYAIPTLDGVVFAISADVPYRKEYLATQQLRNGFRRPIINGKIVMLGKESGLIDWQFKTMMAEVPLAQNYDAPVFLSVERRLIEEPPYSSQEPDPDAPAIALPIEYPKPDPEADLGEGAEAADGAKSGDSLETAPATIDSDLDFWKPHRWVVLCIDRRTGEKLGELAIPRTETALYTVREHLDVEKTKYRVEVHAVGARLEIDYPLVKQP